MQKCANNCNIIYYDSIWGIWSELRFSNVTPVQICFFLLPFPASLKKRCFITNWFLACLHYLCTSYWNIVFQYIKTYLCPQRGNFRYVTNSNSQRRKQGIATFLLHSLFFCHHRVHIGQQHTLYCVLPQSQYLPKRGEIRSNPFCNSLKSWFHQCSLWLRRLAGSYPWTGKRTKT